MRLVSSLPKQSACESHTVRAPSETRSKPRGHDASSLCGRCLLLHCSGFRRCLHAGEVDLDFLSWGFKDRPAVVHPGSRPVPAGLTLPLGEWLPRPSPPSALAVSTTSAACSAIQSAGAKAPAADHGVHAVLVCLTAHCSAASSVHPKMGESQMHQRRVSFDNTSSRMLYPSESSPSLQRRRRHRLWVPSRRWRGLCQLHCACESALCCCECLTPTSGCCSRAWSVAACCFRRCSVQPDTLLGLFACRHGKSVPRWPFSRERRAWRASTRPVVSPCAPGGLDRLGCGV